MPFLDAAREETAMELTILVSAKSQLRLTRELLIFH